MRIADYLKTNRLIMDGAMGTYFAQRYPEEGGLAEAANLTAWEKIKAIHLEYIKSGAKLIRTNTFAANTFYFDTMDTVKRVIDAAWRAACAAVEEAGEDVFIAADIGPVHDPQFLGEEEVVRELTAICDAFLSCGAKLFVLETQSEFSCVSRVAQYLKAQGDVFVIAQFSVDKSGYTRAGLGMERIVQKAAHADSIDAYGFNCGVGAAHLNRLLGQITFPNEKYVTALPNAGYPVTLRGRTTYGDNRKYFVEMAERTAALGIDMLGGCCGTTPAYIRAVKEALDAKPLCRKKTGVKARYAKPAAADAFARLTGRREKLCIAELDPPFGIDISKVMQGAVLLKEAGANLLTLADSPMAKCRMDAGKLAAKVQSEVGISVMPHICCRDKNVIAMRAGILGDYMNGLRYVLAVTGDPVGAEDKGAVTPVFDFNSIRFMEYLSELNADLFADDPVCVCGALNYHGANPEAIADRMRRKMEKGCRMFLTQPVYAKEDVARIAELKAKTGAMILCGILPPVSYKNAVFMANEMPGIRAPKEVIARYKETMTRKEAEEAGVLLGISLAEEAKEIADGYYFMTPFNRAGMIARIIQYVKRQEEAV